MSKKVIAKVFAEQDKDRTFQEMMEDAGISRGSFTPRTSILSGLNKDTTPKPSKKQGRGTRSDVTVDVAGPSVPLTREQAGLQSPRGVKPKLHHKVKRGAIPSQVQCPRLH